MVAETFPSFRDDTLIDGHKGVRVSLPLSSLLTNLAKPVYLWKRAQILVAETWAAFYPPPGNSPPTPHPIFPSGAEIHLLTMFADYRVPQILHHLRILSYPPALVGLLQQGVMLENGSREEVSLRTASIVAVERVRKEMQRMRRENARNREGSGALRKRKGGKRGDDDSEVAIEEERSSEDDISSVLIDFYLWDLAKRIEDGEDKVEGIETAEMVPIHRTRSIWY